MQMQNIYDNIRNGPHFNKLVVNELLFVEYTCPITEKITGLWSKTDTLIHVLSGKKKWKTQDSSWEAKKGDTIYIKKGAYIVEQFFDEDFCMLGFFINEKFIANLLHEVDGKIDLNPGARFYDFELLRINLDPLLSGLMNSMYPFFKSEEKPSSSLLELKLKELILDVLSTDANPELSAYFQSLKSGTNSLKAVMEKNFRYNLSIAEFAELSSRSLSTFKREFYQEFGTTPGKWVTSRRLEYAAQQIVATNESISRIAYDSGFEDVSHFSYAFKTKFEISPIVFRQERSLEKKKQVWTRQQTD